MSTVQANLKPFRFGTVCCRHFTAPIVASAPYFCAAQCRISGRALLVGNPDSELEHAVTTSVSAPRAPRPRRNRIGVSLRGQPTMPTFGSECASWFIVASSASISSARIAAQSASSHRFTSSSGSSVSA
jgi:hypothetical protein